MINFKHMRAKEIKYKRRYVIYERTGSVFNQNTKR